MTGPSTGVGGNGHYYYVESSEPRELGDRFHLSYNGSTCAAAGLMIGQLTFQYHMLGDNMGTLRLLSPSGATLWTLSGDQGTVGGEASDGWVQASLMIHDSTFTFEAVVGDGYYSDLAVDSVEVEGRVEV